MSFCPDCGGAVQADMKFCPTCSSLLKHQYVESDGDVLWGFVGYGIATLLLLLPIFGVDLFHIPIQTNSFTAIENNGNQEPIDIKQTGLIIQSRTLFVDVEAKPFDNQVMGVSITVLVGTCAEIENEFGSTLFSGGDVSKWIGFALSHPIVMEINNQYEQGNHYESTTVTFDSTYGKIQNNYCAFTEVSGGEILVTIGTKLPDGHFISYFWYLSYLCCCGLWLMGTSAGIMAIKNSMIKEGTVVYDEEKKEWIERDNLGVILSVRPDDGAWKNSEPDELTLPPVALSTSSSVTYIDPDGYEWMTKPDGSNWFRIANSDSEWSKWDR